MNKFRKAAALGVSSLALLGAPLSAAQEGAVNASVQSGGERADPFAKFVPTTDPIRHRIDYEIWDFALKNIVISMGPSTRSRPYAEVPPVGTRIRQGHNSRYRLEGSMVSFSSFQTETIESFAEYRRDLESVGDKLDISTLPRNEQLAFWINLHNVALMEKIAAEWPVRQPHRIEVDGVLLDSAKFITVAGVSMSLKDIRERIVFANWKSPKVIYGFWRGEIGGPALERMAYTGNNVGSLLDVAAEDFVNSLRGTQKRGDQLNVSRLYTEAAPFYFPDFENDLRAHLAEYANEEVAEILAETGVIRASIAEQDIADLAGGSRGANYLNGSSSGSRPGIPPGAALLLVQRERKLEVLRREDAPTGRVIFSNIDLPGDPPNKNAVE
ncbi:hypothetical protein NAP1_09897 [Erythrobacter sp. NAP1]|uniref:DUF547 domain-containing protein n=1 Tax=Erythrobacter sp. NAP1 TaxID=237727 RepID=UPI000068515D|nr:DUF547 domain-containing protein [Erythrobacter sp. NAP1]EAQ27898.1 hypothetical protein NAP1_09897 [Erythrobacter sp. NAP1]